jgi:hypothetical protein
MPAPQEKRQLKAGVKLAAEAGFEPTESTRQAFDSALVQLHTQICE